ncbi:MAG: dehydrogenase [Saprospiraceae bacterium]|nr:dehydrogenase [Saprospiraceae bacterium]
MTIKRMKDFRTPPIFVPLLLALLAACSSNVTKEASDEEPRRIEILFLGHDSKHHHSRAYCPILASALTNEGINITYSEDVHDLTTEYLNNFDGVLLYANHEGRHPEQEEALMDYVAAGHAFIPIHCASFCFKDSPDYVELVGGQFKGHGTEVFTAAITNPEHPAMRNVGEFSTWDETYVHDKIADDLEILMQRKDSIHLEPWTWVRNHGKGRVFYTAYGHDERTWANEGFQNLVKEGILWAVSDQARANWSAFMEGMPQLVYEDRDSIPNYEQRDPPLKYQLPLSPDQSAKLMQVPPGFKLELFASEPDIINPIAMNWDEKGRLWVIETIDYPNTVRAERTAGDDCIKILEDTDGDGRSDKVTVFARDLNIPTSLTFIHGGVLVSQAPQFLFLKDTDGDDQADVREVVIDGWGTFDTHAGPSNLQYGIDNKIYGVVGYAGFQGSIFGVDHTFRQGIYRIDLDDRRFEFLANTSNNTWGLGITEENALFASTANNTHSVFMGIPKRYLIDIKGIHTEGSKKIDGHYHMQPITQHVRQVDVFGGFTAAAGHHFYTARIFPESYWNRTAFVCEPTGGLVHIAKIDKVGAGYREVDGGNLFASADEWVSPVEAKVGPDGAVWIADWYNFIVQHNPTPRVDRGGYDALNGMGNAYINPLRDKSRGRIWRVMPRDVTVGKKKNLDINDVDDLIASLSDDNLFWRLTAQRLLVERGKVDVVEHLLKLVKDFTADEMGLNPSSLHAIWTLQGLGAASSNEQAKEVIYKALAHPSASVRKAVVQVLSSSLETHAALQEADLIRDVDAQVQLATLLHFADRPVSDVIGELLFQVSGEERFLDDSWLAQALYIAACRHRGGFLKAFQQAAPDKIQEMSNEAKKQDIDFSDTSWETMTLPQSIEDAGIQLDGIIWFRKQVNLDPDMMGRPGMISLGPIDDGDIVFVNGTKIGGLKDRPRENRQYEIPANVLVAGKNLVAVQVEDTRGSGGFVGEKDQLYIVVGNSRISLAGAWIYQVETDFSDEFSAFEKESMPEVLYRSYQDSPNAMDTMFSVNADVTEIHIKTIKNEMKYDVTEFSVQAGSTVALILENVDFMQHNLVIVQEGTQEIVGTAADALATDPKGETAGYIPDLDEVLFATDLVDPNQKVLLRFTAPSEPGDYPYICTFPGHWRIMQGVMRVLSERQETAL